MYDVKTKLKEVLTTLPADVTLAAVSKFHPKEYLMAAYEEGQRVFAESQVQELRQKQSELPDDIEWHFIGHLQTNKVKYIAPYISLIHSVDSLRLLKEIDRQAERCDRTIDVLLELHVAQEETKSGMTASEMRDLLSSDEFRNLNHVAVRGLMTMASFVDDEEQIRKEFMQAKDVFNELKRDFFANEDSFSIRSYGMSGDYQIAMECGSNMVRIGTTIFGPRVY